VFLFGSTFSKRFAAFAGWNFWGNFFAKPFSDPREFVVSGLHLLCPYLEVNRLVILGRFSPFCRG
jgi:hypothetical protein